MDKSEAHEQHPFEARRPVGRPPRYTAAFCEQVESFMAEGHSLTAFGAHIGVDRSTLTIWQQRHPQFFTSCARGKALQLLAWERHALRMAQKGAGPGGASIVSFALRNLGGDEYAADKRAKVALPRVDSPKAATTAISEALAAFAAGQIDRENAEAIVNMARGYLGAVEIVEIEQRLAALEQAGGR